MQLPLPVGDFDVDIEKIFLVHKCIYEKRYRLSEYVNGRNMHGLVYCISGKARYNFDGETMYLEPGQMVFLPASCAYSIEHTGDTPFFHITVNFLIRNMSGDDKTVFSELLSGNLRYVSAKDKSAYLKDLLERLVQVWQSKKTGYNVQAKSLLYEALYAYFSEAGNSFSKTEDYNLLLPAKKVLDEEYMKSCPVSELAKLCGLSETHFRRLFVKLFGCSPTDYRINKRILKAKDLLLSGDFSVSETAFEVGFEDANYFSRVFKLHTGISPSRLLKTGLEKNVNNIKVMKN